MAARIFRIQVASVAAAEAVAAVVNPALAEVAEVEYLATTKLIYLDIAILILMDILQFIPREVGIPMAAEADRA
jgi:hypothetical protein